MPPFERRGEYDRLQEVNDSSALLFSRWCDRLTNCYTICDIILFAVLPCRAKCLQAFLTQLLILKILATDRCALLQVFTGQKISFCYFEGLVPERVCWFKSSPQHRNSLRCSELREGPKTDLHERIQL